MDQSIPQLTDLQWAYLAGLIDGEGSINAGVHKASPPRNQNDTYQAHLEIHMTTAEPIQTVNSWLERRTPYYHVKSGQWYFSLWGDPLRDVLRAVRPFLILKGDQADLALQMLELRQPRRRGDGGRLLPLDPEVASSLNRLHLALKASHIRRSA